MPSEVGTDQLVDHEFQIGVGPHLPALDTGFECGEKFLAAGKHHLVTESVQHVGVLASLHVQRRHDRDAVARVMPSLNSPNIQARQARVSGICEPSGSFSMAHTGIRHQIGLGRIPAVHGGAGHPSLVCDRFNRAAVVAVLGQQPQGGGDDQLVGIGIPRAASRPGWFRFDIHHD